MTFGRVQLFLFFLAEPDMPDTFMDFIKFGNSHAFHEYTFSFCQGQRSPPIETHGITDTAVVLTLEFSFFSPDGQKTVKVVFANFTGCDRTNDGVVASPRILARKHECAHE